MQKFRLSGEEKAVVGSMIFVGAVVLASIGGWIANIVKLAGTGFEPFTWLAVIRAIGIFVAPLGAVLGYV